MLLPEVGSEEMTSTASQTYLIVSHGGYIQEFISWLFDEYGFEQPEGYEGYFWQSPNQPNASLTQMSMTLYVCTGAAGLSNITFSSMFCNQHLEGMQGLTLKTLMRNFIFPRTMTNKE